jgi:prepilin-type N-terminal cleavage/methylation domain-containing protein
VRLIGRAASRKRQGAFTLIELVVALALIGLLSAALFDALRFAQRSYQKVVRSGDLSWEVFATQRLIRSIVESAYPQQAASVGTTPFGLEGRTDRLEVIATAPLAAGGAGLYRYEIGLREGEPGRKDIVVRWRPDYVRGASSSAPEWVGEEILLEGIDRLEWEFFEMAGDAGGTAPTWRSQWLDRRALPHLVRLSVTFPRGDARRWPALVIAPRITDDANCTFDVITQRCRTST